ncbi:contractile injection system protein, VgrG/Pvc8 family, partial [Escherichia coli]|uniref:contractile injection system protein, VgrG/Pvc8 family n=1 Tax=Escherichia coli TaxID=562 RepID=UPI003D241D3C
QEGQHQDYQRTQYEVYDYPGRFKGAHGQNFARWQMDGWRNNAEVARGTSRSPEIWPGRRIALTGHPQANLNREWQVVASDLHGEQPQAVWLTHDPAYPDEQPTAPLARYTYTAGGELRAVYDRSGTQVRGFTYDAEHAGRMVAHHYAGRPESCYRYDDTGRVTEQVNPEGLDYRFEYGESRVIITDSLNRREVLYTEGEGGLKRVVKKEHADGSITRSEYDEAGRLKAQTDAAGRRTEYSLHMASGAVTAVTGPDGRTVRYGYNSQRQVTSVTYPDGLRSSREYDEKGRLTAETSRSGETTRYSYDDPASELPTGIQDATGSTKQMAWSRYG